MSNPFPNRTFTDEQLKNMSYDDMMLSIYHCQFVKELSLEECKDVSLQLMRILFRITGNRDIDLQEIHTRVMIDDLDTQFVNGFITEKEYDERMEEINERGTE